MSFIANIKTVFADDVDTRDKDGADLVQTVIIVAGFAVISIVTVNWLGGALVNKAADAAECIEGANTYTAQESAEKCKNADHAKKGSFKNQDSYKSRFGNK